MFHIRRSGVRLDQCSCVGAFVVGLIIFGSYFYGSTTFRMSTRRLPVILVVSRFECPLYPVVCCAMCLGWPKGYNILYASNGVSVLSDSFLVFCLSSSSHRLRGLSANLTARAYVKGYSVNCFCSDISYFHYMSVSCPSVLCLSASLPLVTSQARLESDGLEPQSGVTAGLAVCSRLWVVRTGILRSLLTSLNRLGFM